MSVRAESLGRQIGHTPLLGLTGAGITPPLLRLSASNTVPLLVELSVRGCIFTIMINERITFTVRPLFTLTGSNDTNITQRSGLTHLFH